MEHQILHASEGMVLTDGTHGGTTVYLAAGENAEDWQEVPLQTYVSTLESGWGNGASEEDYQDALKEFGVML